MQHTAPGLKRGLERSCRRLRSMPANIRSRARLGQRSPRPGEYPAHYLILPGNRSVKARPNPYRELPRGETAELRDCHNPRLPKPKWRNFRRPKLPKAENCREPMLPLREHAPLGVIGVRAVSEFGRFGVRKSRGLGVG